MSTAAAVVLCPGKKNMKTSTTTTTTRSWIVNGLFHSPLQKRRIGNDRRHFHQLFHQLWLTTQTSRRDVLQRELGHAENLPGNRTQRTEETEDIHQLFSHQQHRDVKNRQRRRGVDDLVHWVLLNPLLRPDASEAVRPRPGGRHLIHVRGKGLGACHLGGGMFRNLAV